MESGARDERRCKNLPRIFELDVDWPPDSQRWVRPPPGPPTPVVVLVFDWRLLAVFRELEDELSELLVVVLTVLGSFSLLFELVLEVELERLRLALDR